MIRFYSLFITDDQLLASPYIRRFNKLHDITLNLRKKEIVNFLLQTKLNPEQKKQLHVIYDPMEIAISKIDIKTFEHQTLLSVSLTPKELGSVRIGFSIPILESADQTNPKKFSSPLMTVPCFNLRKSPLIRRKRGLMA